MKKYDVSMDLTPGSIAEKMIHRVESGSTVLEFGCSYGRMTKYMKEQLHCDVCIIELDPEAFQAARQYAGDGFCGDIDQGDWFPYFSERRFDRILFADVLEHLRDPIGVLKQAKSLLKDTGEVLISMPNIGHNDILANLYLNRFDYTPTGLLDDSHIHFWGAENLAQLAENAGYGLRLLDGVYQPPFHTEQSVNRGQLPAALTDVLALRKYNEVYQFFMVLQKREWMERCGLSFENKLCEYHDTLSFGCCWDVGDGYQAEQGLRLFPRLTEEGKFRLRCNLIPDGCQRVRIDFPLGYYCIVSDIDVITDVSSCNIYPLNGISGNGVIVFSTTNPQMEFLLPARAQWFEIVASFQLFSSQEYERFLSSQQESAAAIERVSALQEQVEQLAKANLLHQDQLEEEFAREELLQERKQQALDKITQLEKQLAQVHASLHERQTAYATIEAQYLAVVHSNFWKLTKPLRSFITAVKKVMGKGRTDAPANGTEELAGTPQCRALQVDIPDTPDKPLTLSDMAAYIVGHDGQAFNSELFLASDISTKKKVLLVSHELNLTGAPIALNYFAKVTKQQGYFPVFISPHDGALCDQLEREGFPVFVFEQLFTSDLVYQFAGIFDLIVVCTNLGAPVIADLNGANVPVIWWIHEAQVSYTSDTLAAMPVQLKENIHVYSVCTYADRILKQHRPNYSTDQLLYAVPDFTVQLPDQPTFRLKYAEGKIVFALVGMQEERKGQDLLIQAIRRLPPELLKKCLFVFVGKPWYAPILTEILAITEEYPRNVLHIEELSRQDMLSLYMQIDCLICASRDDPMPIVVTEAMLMSKSVICSEHTGSADLLKQMDAGLIYHNNDPAELVECIEFICAHHGQDDLTAMCSRARETYERFFSLDVFEQSVKTALDRFIDSRPALSPFSGKVSVVIPTYNAGEDIDRLIHLLHAQEDIGEMEILVVDSESRDGTAERAEQLGAKVIRIRQAEFSHSYARNLGAESASGEYLLFMTQDAIPSGPKWVAELMQPVLRDGVVAVSCREEPKPDSDLLGRVSIWGHSGYMGIIESDRLLRMPDQQDYDSLRRNGQLDDVSCLIRRDLFMQFKYRGNYAEDLDLGLRLIRAGYTLALLATVPVIHSHTRPPLYHMKRALVDMRTLKTILPDMPIEKLDAQTMVNRIVTAYGALAQFLDRAAANLAAESLDDFLQWSERSCSEIKKAVNQMDGQELLNLVRSSAGKVDESIQEVVAQLASAYQDKLAPDVATVEAWLYELVHVIPYYLAAHEILFDQKVRREMLELLPKYTAQQFGMLLASYAVAHPQEEGFLHEIIAKLSTGV